MFENFSFENLLKIENCKLKIILVFLAICYTLFASNKVHAAGVSLGVFPPIIQIQADPPANIDTPVTIQNLGSETVNLDIVFKPFTAKDSENGEISFLPNNKIHSKIFEKIQIFDGDKPLSSCHPEFISGSNEIPNQVRDDIPCLTLSPKQQKKLTLKINIGKDEPISDYYFSVIFLNSPPTSPAQTPNTQAQGGVAVNVLLSIGKGQAKGVIEEFSSPLFLEKGPVPFTLRVKNTGKHVIAPIGQILIKNFFGQTVGKVDLLPVNILSQTTRSIPDSEQYKSEARNSKLETPQEYLPLRGGANSNDQNSKNNSVSDFDIRHSNFRSFPEATWPENFLLGPYTATLTLALSDEGPIYKKNINFFGAPTQIFIGLIIAILLVWLIVGKVRKRLLTSN